MREFWSKRRFYGTHVLPILSFSLLVIPTTQALADEQANFLKLIQEPSEQQLVLNAAKQSPVVLKNPCASAKFTLVNQFAIYKPLAFDSSDNISDGAWQQTVSESGCGQNRLLKVLLFLDAHSNGLKARPLYPGSTRANPILQKDALIHAVMAAGGLQEDYKNAYVADTEFLNETGHPLEGVSDKPWNELWTLNIAGKKAQVIMHFIPDGTGTAIHASLQEPKF